MNRTWTIEQEQIVKDLFSDTETKEIAEILGKTTSSVLCKSYQLKLKRSDAFLVAQKKMFADTLRREGAKTRYKKGNVPHSKGKKREEFMTAAGIEKVKATEFKKNRVPHNWVPIGFERISKDGYIEIKFTDNYGMDSAKNFDFKHRLIWIEKNGPIPLGMNVGFLDGDKRNFAIENLVLMNKAENLMKSCFSEKAIAKKMFKPKTDAELDLIMQKAGSLIKARQTQIKINKLINDYGREN